MLNSEHIQSNTDETSDLVRPKAAYFNMHMFSEASLVPKSIQDS